MNNKTGQRKYKINISNILEIDHTQRNPLDILGIEQIPEPKTKQELEERNLLIRYELFAEMQKDEPNSRDKTPLLFNKALQLLFSKHPIIIDSHKVVFSNFIIDIVREGYISDQLALNIENYFQKYVAFLTDWREFLKDYENIFTSMLSDDPNSETLDSFISLFTRFGVTITAESFLNTLKETNVELYDKVVKIPHFIIREIEFSIEKEKKAALEIIKLHRKLSTRELIKELLYPSKDCMRYISFLPSFDDIKIKRNTKNPLIKEMIEIDESNTEDVFRNFLSFGVSFRAQHRETIKKIIGGEQSLSEFTDLKEIEHTIENIRENILTTNNILLNRKEELMDIFSNGTRNELRYVEYWMSNNTDRNILSGIFMSKALFEIEDLDDIIEESIQAQITHNNNLLERNNYNLVLWLISGISEK